MTANENAATLERVAVGSELYLFTHEHAWYKLGTDHIGATIVACTLCPDVCVDGDSWPACHSEGPNGEQCHFPMLGPHTICESGSVTWDRPPAAKHAEIVREES